MFLLYFYLFLAVLRNQNVHLYYGAILNRIEIGFGESTINNEK